MSSLGTAAATAAATGAASATEDDSSAAPSASSASAAASSSATSLASAHGELRRRRRNRCLGVAGGNEVQLATGGEQHSERLGTLVLGKVDNPINEVGLALVRSDELDQVATIGAREHHKTSCCAMSQATVTSRPRLSVVEICLHEAPRRVRAIVQKLVPEIETRSQMGPGKPRTSALPQDGPVSFGMSARRKEHRSQGCCRNDEQGIRRHLVVGNEVGQFVEW